MKLFDIDSAIRDLIDDLVDQETGELPPEADAALERLQLDKNKVILHLAALAKEADIEAEAIAGELERLGRRKKAAENRSDHLRVIVKEHLGEGNKIKDERVSLWWGTSKKSVEILPEAPPPEEWPALFVRCEVSPDREMLRAILEPKPGDQIDPITQEAARLFARIAPGKKYLVIR